jgi:hypothetical protein
MTATALPEMEPSHMRVAYRRNDPLSNINRMQNELYNTDVSVSGAPDRAVEAKLEVVYRGAEATVEHAMNKRGLYSTSNGRKYLRVERMDPEETGGFIGGYTSGGPITINECIIPGTGGYGRFRQWMDRQRGNFARYLYDKFGTDERAEYSIGKTTVHEVGHNKLQLNSIKKYDGTETSPFAEALVERLTERYQENLPKGAKWLGKFLAYRTYKPLIEGLNEAMTEGIYNHENTQTIKEKRAKGPTTYDAFTAAAADTLGKIGRDESGDPYYTAMDFYSDYADRPKAMLDRYIDGFFSSYSSLAKGGCAGGANCYSMAPAQPCVLKAA